MDLLRRYERRHVELVGDWSEDGPAAGAGDSSGDRPDPEAVRAALATFLELPVAQRSAVVLKDVLGCTLEEIVESTGATLPAVKAALVRGRAALQARAARPDEGALSARRRPSPWSESEDRARLHRYAALFNARDWEALRELLAQDARLDLVSRTERRGRAVGEYFSRYADLRDFRVVPGLLEDPTGGRPALSIHSPRSSEQPSYLVLIEWRGEQVALIRDFRYVPYIADEIRLGHARFTPDALP
jgi:RNA polymerase sigma-70 factor (ECF subfamily)